MERVPGLDRNEMVIDLGYGLSSELISLSPPHGQGTRGCRTLHDGERPSENIVNTECAPLSSELWHHTAYPAQSKPEATWAQPLSREELS